jgi:hypothetical protein
VRHTLARPREFLQALLKGAGSSFYCASTIEIVPSLTDSTVREHFNSAGAVGPRHWEQWMSSDLRYQAWQVWAPSTQLVYPV